MGALVRASGNVRVVELKGEITMGRHLGRPLDLQGRPVDDLRGIIDDLLRQGHPRIVLDLSGVKFIDSAGLGELIAARRRAVEQGGDMVLIHPRGHVKDLLVMTLLTDVFRICENEAEALAAFPAR